MDGQENHSPYPITAPGFVADADITNDGRSLFTVMENGVINAWDVQQHQHHSELPACGQVLSLSTDDRYLAVLESRKEIKVLNRTTFVEVLSIPTNAQDFALAWAPGEPVLAVAIDDRTVVTIDVESQKVLRRFKLESKPRTVAFTPDGSQLIVACESLQVWDTKSGLVQQVAPVGARQLAFLPGGASLLAGETISIGLYDVPSMHHTATLVMNGLRLTSIDLSGHTLAVGMGEPTSVSLWDVRTHQMLMVLETEEAQKIKKVLFSHDGRRLIVVGSDNTGHGRIWEWAIRTDF